MGEYSEVEQSFEDINIVSKYNQAGTFAVLEFVRKKGCKILYAGSSTKFGDSGTGKNDSPYAWTKSVNTELVKNYGKWFDILLQSPIFTMCMEGVKYQLVNMLL